MPYVTYGIYICMTEMRKITAFIPADLLESGQRITGEGISETLREALRRMKHAWACEQLLTMSGTVDLEADGWTLDELRDDGPEPWTTLKAAG